VAAGARTAARRIAAALCWASAAYVLLRVSFYYLHTAGTRRHHVEAASIFFVIALIVRAITADRVASSDTAERPPQQPPSTLLAAVGFVGAALLLYWPVLFTGLFADDFVLVEAARAGRFTVWSELFRPSLFAVWRALLAISPEGAVGLHAMNVVLHGVNAFLVCRLASAIRLSRAIALCAGALFVAYPAAVEAVAWPSGIQDVLMTTCVLIVLVVGVASRRPVARVSWAGAALVVALLTKETAIAAPALLLVLGLIREIRKPAWLTAAACAVIVTIFLGVRFSMLPLPSGYSPAATRYAAKELLVRPFATLVVPFRADETLRHPALGILSAAFVVLLLASGAGRGGWRDPAAARTAAATGMVLGAVAPVLAYFYVDPDLLGSRYLYLALTGWVLLLATSASSLGSRGGRAIAPLVFLIVFWIPATRSHLLLWQNAATARESILAAAAGASDPACSGWVVSGVPATLDGVPLFVNGFPEAARPALGEPIHMAPAARAGDQCQLTWTGQAFKRAE
jgi:hypothetical protein